MWKYYYSKLSKGIDIGYNPKPKFYDADLVHSLKNNIAQFSAFKETSFKNAIESLLIEDGKLVPWSQFKKKAFAISGDYNKRWLETEYHQTVATANMAEKWQGWQRNKDLYPNLKYVTVGDKRVRLKHQQWDGLILPIDHPWWLEHLPPNDHGCRCDAVQTDEEVTKDIPSAAVKKGFDNNPAVSGEIFKEITYANGLTGKEIKQASVNSLTWLLKISKGKQKQFIERAILSLPRKLQFETIRDFNNGKVLRHLLASTTAQDYKEVLEAAIAFAKRGDIVEMLPVLNDKALRSFRKKIFPNYIKTNNPDLKIGKVYLDVKSPKAIKNITQRANEAAIKQNAVAVIHCGELIISLEILERRARAILDSKNPYYHFTEVHFYYQGKIITFS